MRHAYFSELAGQPLKKYISALGYHISLVDHYGQLHEYVESDDSSTRDYDPNRLHVDPRIATHADIYMCQLGLWEDAGLYLGDPDKLQPDYPGDAIYNALVTRDYYVHIMPGTDDDLVEAMMMWRKQVAFNDMMESLRAHKKNDPNMSEEHVRALGVNQGYTRCTCLPVDDSSFITSDEGLAGILENQGANVLRIRQGHILLPGFDYGFIGGCAGHIYVKSLEEDVSPRQRAIIFNGDLSAHPDFKAIDEFIKSRNIYPVYFKEYPLEDIGSILVTE